MNGVAMARNGLILGQNEAVGSRKVSKYLMGVRGTIFSQNIYIPKIHNPQIQMFTIILYGVGSMGEAIKLLYPSLLNLALD